MSNSPLRIGKYEIGRGLMLAPMAGYTDWAFRRLCREFSCPLTYTEMASACALSMNDRATKNLLKRETDDGVCAAQIFGNVPEYVAKACKYVKSIGFDIIDINMGCPAPKIVNNGSGSALMLNLSLAEDVLKAAVDAVDIPITVKMRRGWEATPYAALELADIAQRAGCAAVTVHPRTREQFYYGEPDMHVVTEVKKQCSIPVFYSGNVFTHRDVSKILDTTNADGVMAARGATGNPWIFMGNVREDDYIPALEEKKEVMKKHYALCAEDKGEALAVKEMRKHFHCYIKGIEGAATLRSKINYIQDFAEVMKFIDEIGN
ncbi:MAG: tRNA dihydrouridine synthase DusB [Clostridiales bacterium]|nr:tRNA dihydrouridine synthase DusB [Clostridiales bacterium]